MTFYLIKDEGGVVKRIGSSSVHADAIATYLENRFGGSYTKESVTIDDTSLQAVYSALASEMDEYL
jgi:hypothetical protein